MTEDKFLKYFDGEERKHYEEAHQRLLSEGNDENDARFLAFLEIREQQNRRYEKQMDSEERPLQKDEGVDYDALIPEVMDRLDPIFRRVAEERPFDDGSEERR